jgi:hypothetical protein
MQWQRIHKSKIFECSASTIVFADDNEVTICGVRIALTTAKVLQEITMPIPFSQASERQYRFKAFIAPGPVQHACTPAPDRTPSGASTPLHATLSHTKPPSCICLVHHEPQTLTRRANRDGNATGSAPERKRGNGGDDLHQPLDPTCRDRTTKVRRRAT